jgi:protein TonB
VTQPKQATAPPTTVAPVDAAPTTIPQQTATTDSITATTADDGTGTGIERGIPEGIKGGVGTDKTGIGNPVVPEGPIRVIGDVKAPVTIQRVMPVYPPIAMRGRIEGWVIVECIIDKSGHIREARAVRSSFAPFEQSAVDAVQQWVFKPGTLHGEPVDVIFNLTVTFTIQR